MLITIRCPRCGEMRLVADDTPEETVKCTGCGVSLRVPRKKEAPPPEFSPSFPAAAPAPPTTTQNPFAESAPAYVPKHVETQNPYQAPATTFEGYTGAARGVRFIGPDPRLASRWKRFGGALLDNLILFGPFYAYMVYLETSGPQMNDDMVGIMMLFGVGFVGIMLVVHCVLISTRGQSIAKMLLGMQIVRTTDDELPGFVNGVLLRGFVSGIIGAIPLVGHIYNLADPLFIFSEDKQCLHDKIASTKVLDVALMEQYAQAYGKPGRRVTVNPWDR